MAVGRFIAMVGMLVWRRSDGRVPVASAVADERLRAWGVGDRFR